jgi:hypothetical protein
MNQPYSVQQIALGLVLGALIWALSPMLAGRLEPFDNALYFWLAMFLAGAHVAVADPRRFWIAPVTIYVGQYAYVALFIPSLRPSLVFGLVVGIFFQLPSVLGALAVYVMWRLTRRTDASE